MTTPLSLWPARGPILPRKTMALIAATVGQRYGLTVHDMRENTRAKRISHPRQEAMAEMHEAGFSHHQIVRFFSLRDHTSSVHACRVVKERRALAQQEAA